MTAYTGDTCPGGVSAVDDGIYFGESPLQKASEAELDFLRVWAKMTDLFTLKGSPSDRCVSGRDCLIFTERSISNQLILAYKS
jgi:hypothetical protein